MANDNTKQLQGLLKLFSAEKIITPEDIQAVLGGIVNLLNSFKKANESLNADTKAVMQQTLATVNDQIASLRAGFDDNRTQIATETKQALAVALNDVQKLVSEARSVMPKDGKNPDPADVVPLVLEQIRLPENKQYVLTGEDVINALNELPADERYQIDAARIKNLPQATTRLLGGGAAVRPRLLHYDLTPQCNGSTKVFNVPLNFGIVGVFSTQAPMIYRPLVDWTEGNRTLTLTSQVDAPQTGQTLWISFIR